MRITAPDANRDFETLRDRQRRRQRRKAASVLGWKPPAHDRLVPDEGVFFCRSVQCVLDLREATEAEAWAAVTWVSVWHPFVVAVMPVECSEIGEVQVFEPIVTVE